MLLEGVRRQEIGILILTMTFNKKARAISSYIISFFGFIMKLINKFLIVFNTLHTDVNWFQKFVELEKELETFKWLKSVLFKERLWFH